MGGIDHINLGPIGCHAIMATRPLRHPQIVIERGVPCHYRHVDIAKLLIDKGRIDRIRDQHKRLAGGIRSAHFILTAYRYIETQLCQTVGQQTVAGRQGADTADK